MIMSDEALSVAEPKLVVDRVQLSRIFQLSGLLSADAWDNKKLEKRCAHFTEPDLAEMKTDEDR
jgi:hypothetical protein